MKAIEFCRWFQGFLEMEEVNDGDIEISERQVDVIKKHLQLVFKYQEIQSKSPEALRPEDVKEALKNFKPESKDPYIRC